MAPDARRLLADPDCLALAPLLYVAWADGELEKEEIAAVRGLAHDLTSAQRDALDGWLDPQAPPSSTELLRLYAVLQRELRQLDAAARGSLVDAGLALAKRRGGEQGEASYRALREIEAALGLTGSEVVRELFVERPPVEQVFSEPAPRFDAAVVTRWLDGTYRDDWVTVRALLAEGDFAPVPGDITHHRYREQVKRWLEAIAAAGLGALAYPETAGGAGRLDRFAVVFAALGMFDLSLVVKFGVQFGLFGGAILHLGTERHHRELLPAIGRAEHLGGFAMTELGHGSNVRDLETIARYVPERDGFEIHSPSPSARKEWIGNAAVHGRTMVVFAQLEVGEESHGVHAFVVPVRDDDGRPLAGIHIDDCGAKMGLNGVDNGRLRFDHVEVPREALLDRHGAVVDGHYESPIASPNRRFFTMLGTLVGGRIAVGSAAVTASKVALATAIRYGALRRQFGPAGESERAILDYPTHQRRLFPRLAATYALHVATMDLVAAWRDHDGEDTRELEAHAAGIKALATWHAIDATQQCRECCGGMGFLSENRIAEIRKDVDVFATFEGDNVVLLQLVAKSLLTGYAKSLSTDLVGTLLRQIGRRAQAELLHANPFATRRTSDDHLRDRAFHEAAFAFRTESLLQSAARRVKKRTDAGMDAFDAVMDIQSHLVSLAVAHTEQRVLEGFGRAIETLPNPARDAIERMRSLYALWRLHEDMAWFLENEYVEPVKARAMRRLVDALCREIRPDALPLVEAFGIPAEVLTAPIAHERYVEVLGGKTQGGEEADHP